ncbi:MAG TPA: DNA polymerase III subunit alpha [Parachlamydiaceae bacterium]|nr:DNA polymerase III subunit alpha [Parachlamydiaceae bacterium]
MGWIPLNVHSQYSILDATPSVKAIAEKTKALSMDAVALTDNGNLFGIVEFYKACKEVSVKPIIGVQVYVAPGSRLDKKKEYGVRTSYTLTLLAKNNAGYQNLCKLSSIGYLEGFYYNPRIDYETLKQYSDGLIVLSSGQYGEAFHEALNGTKESLYKMLKSYQALFGEDYYIELQRHKMSELALREAGLYEESWLLQAYEDYIAKQEKANALLIEAAKELGIKLVATNDTHYLEQKDFRAHEILLNIQSGEPVEIWQKDSLGNPKFRILNPKRKVYFSKEHYFKSQEEMQELFKEYPEALLSTLEIAGKCHVELDFKTKHYPVYLPPSLNGKTYTKEIQAKEVEKYLLELCEEGIKKRYTKEKLDKIQELFPGKDPETIVRERLKLEVDVIVPKEMADYLLIVWDFINWAKTNGIPMGPGRGSGAGSIILYLIGITDIEPLRFHLFFERFINPERLSYPDIDVDICMERRGDVIEYTLNKYGKDNVAQIITFGTMKAKMTIKDVGRVLSVPLAKVNAIAKLVPEDLNITLEKALKDPELKAMYEEDEDAKRIIDLGTTLEGSIRNTGIHAAGIIISGEPLTNFIPLCNAKDSEMPVTQYSMKPVELVGMLKVDFLGLKTLTAIQIAVESIKANGGEEIDWVNLDLNNQATFDLLNQGKTLGTFQLESSGMQDLAKQLHLDKFEEIIAVGALYRPGPMDMIPSFINRKHGKEPIEYDHPWMKDILSETYGIMVYQEQVMQIASRLAKYSLGEGDVLRRAMGKKDAEQMAKEREKFRLGALENQIDEETSMRIFDKMEKFAQYGFNKSHAAAYGYLSYVTAYLKANYPSEWMAALMTCDFDDLTKVAKFIGECQAMNIAVLPPDINEAKEVFIATKAGIRFAMAGIKGVGRGVVDAIVQERKKRGAFSSLYDFLKRIDTNKVHKKTIENLVDAGCFDFTGWSRDALKMSVDPMFEAASKDKKESEIGIMSLFSLMGESNEERFKKEPKIAVKRKPLELLLKEKELLGFFLTGHPMDAYRDVLKRLSCVPFTNLEMMDHDQIFRAVFIVESVETKVSSKTEKKFAILQVSDGIERRELPIWSELFEEKGHLLKENQLIYAVLQVDKKEESLRIGCKWLDDLTVVNEAMVEACDLAFDKAKMQAARFAKLKSTNPEAQKSKTEAKSVAKNEEIKKNQMLSVKFNMDKMRLSHILQMKKLFSEKRGTTPVLLEFLSQNQVVGTLQIDAKWGVSIDHPLQTNIKNVPSFLSLEIK